MIWHSNDIESVIKELKTNVDTGLSSSDAKFRCEHLFQKIERKKTKPSFFKFLFEEINNPSYIGLAILAVVVFLFHFIFKTLSIFDSLSILGLLIVKASVSAFIKRHYTVEIDKGRTEEKSISKVLRDGEIQQVDSKALVPGDIILVSQGDYIPVDARLIRESDLHCDEYYVTGETIPTQKNANMVLQAISTVSERANMIFAGSSVVAGTGVAIVTEIEDYTEYGKKLAIESEQEIGSLSIEDRLNHLSKLLNTILFGGYAVIFLISLIASLISKQFSNSSFLNSFLYSGLIIGALMVGFMPSSLEALSTATVSRAIKRMKKKGISLFHTKTIDSIAKIDIICADKTGIFTKNKMVLTQMFTGAELIDVNHDSLLDEHKSLIRLAALCCDGEVEKINGKTIESGDPTQTAILSASMDYLGLSKYDLDNIYPRIEEIPFDPDKKVMATINVIDGKKYVIVRGSIDSLINRCTNDCKTFIDAAKEMSEDNLRVIGVCIKPMDDFIAGLTDSDIESGLRFMGIIGLEDPIRSDSKDYILDCKKAGIKVIMLTGDNETAAFCTAYKLRIANYETQVLSGEIIAELNDEQLKEAVEKYTVFAKINSSDRLRIVNALKSNGHHVAITGDTAQNTISLRAADVGYAMGKSGSDVAICASEVILENDSFRSVARSIRNCKGVFHKIAKSLKFYMSATLGLIISVLLGSIIFGIAPLTPAELIIVSIISVLLMALGMVYEPSEKEDIFLKADYSEKIFNAKFLFDVIFNGAIIGLGCLVSYAVGCGTDSPSSFAFITTSLFLVLAAIASRTKKPIISFSTENYRIFVFAGIALLSLVIICIIGPGSFKVFSFLYWLYAILLALITTLFLTCIKFIRN